MRPQATNASALSAINRLLLMYKLVRVTASPAISWSPADDAASIRRPTAPKENGDRILDRRHPSALHRGFTFGSTHLASVVRLRVFESPHGDEAIAAI